MNSTTIRTCDLEHLLTQLEIQQAQKRDVVVNTASLRYEDGNLIIPGAADAVLTEDGVTVGDLKAGILDEAESQIGSRLDIPRRYVRKMRADSLVSGEPILDTTMNYWLAKDPGRALVRSFVDENGEGLCRAVLSDRFRIIDHLDTLSAVISGIARSATEPGSVTVESADLSDRSMTVRFVAPNISLLAPALLNGYRSPFTGAYGTDNPVVSAGFVLRNSETGGGAYTLVPRIRVKVCNNGLIIAKDAMREVHIGKKLDEGVIEWSDATRRKQIDLISSQASDAVATFLSAKWVERTIADLERQAGVAVTSPEQTITHVARTLLYSDDERSALMDHFIRGGLLTAGGVLHAVTSMAQVVDDPDRSWEIESDGLRAMALVSNI